MKNFIAIILLLSITAINSFGQPATSRDTKTQYRTYAYGGLAVGKTKNSIPVDSITVVDGVWKAYKNGVQLNTPDKDVMTLDTAGTVSNASRVALTTRYDFKKEFAGDPTAKALNGWTTTNDIVLAPMCPLNFQAGGGLTSGTLHITALDPVTDTTKCNGVMFTLSTAFSGTIGAWNGISLFRVDGETYTQVATTGNVATLWNTAGAKQIIPFTTPYTALPGQLFYVVGLYQGTGTAPVTIDVGLLTNNYSERWLGGNNKLASTLGSQTSIPATITASSTVRAVYMKGFLIY